MINIVVLHYQKHYFDIHFLHSTFTFTKYTMKVLCYIEVRIFVNIYAC